MYVTDNNPVTRVTIQLHIILPPPLVVVEPMANTHIGSRSRLMPHAWGTDTPLPQLWPPGIHDCAVTIPRPLPHHQPCGHLAQVRSHSVFGRFRCSTAHLKANYHRFQEHVSSRRSSEFSSVNLRLEDPWEV
jgi:hypothetical protein